MELLDYMRFYNSTKRLPVDCIREAVYQDELFSEGLTEGEDDGQLHSQVMDMIAHDNYIVDDYDSFVRELGNNKRSPFLTQYSADELRRLGVHTFQVPNHEIGFALKPMPDGDMDIIGVHNNTEVRNIGDALIDSAVRLGGTTLDHYDGFLSDFYSKKGFKEYDRWKWDNKFAPSDWDYSRYGTPDVVLRRLSKQV